MMSGKANTYYTHLDSLNRYHDDRIKAQFVEPVAVIRPGSAPSGPRNKTHHLYYFVHILFSINPFNFLCV